MCALVLCWDPNSCCYTTQCVCFDVETLFCCHPVAAEFSFLPSLVKSQLNPTGSLLATRLRLMIMLVRPINNSKKGVSPEA